MTPPDDAAPRVFHYGRDKLPTKITYVARPSKWGNPFKIGRDGTREEVIERYRQHLEEHPELKEAARRELRGKHLACWCAPLPCHADVLLEVANA